MRSGLQLWPKMTEHTGGVSSVALCEDGGRVLSLSDEKTVPPRNVKTGSQVGQSMTRHKDRVTCVVMSKDGKLAVSRSRDETMRYWDLETQSQNGNRMAGLLGGVCSVAMSADGTRALSGSTICAGRLGEGRRGPRGLDGRWLASVWEGAATGMYEKLLCLETTRGSDMI